MKVFCIRNKDGKYKTKGLENLIVVGEWYEVAPDNFSTQVMGDIIAETHYGEVVNLKRDYFIAIRIPNSGIAHYPRNWFQTIEEVRENNINKILNGVYTRHNT